jgi:hypothetical protein
MYKILFFLLMFSSVLFSQTWQNTLTLNTGLTIDQNDRIDLYTNQDGNHIIIHKSNQLYYYLYTYNGLHVRHTVIDNFTELPKLSRVTGWEDKVYVIYKKGSDIYCKRSENAGQSWTNITPISMVYSVSNGLEVTTDDAGVHMAWSEQYGAPDYYETNYSKLRHDEGFWSDFKQVTDETGEDGDLPSITTSSDRVFISYSGGGTFNTMKLRIKDGTSWLPREEISPYWPPYLMGHPVPTHQNNVIADQDNLNVFYYGILDTPVEGEGSYLQFIYRDNSINSGSWSYDENYDHDTNTLEEIRLDITLTPNNHLHSVFNGGYYEEYYNGTFTNYPSIYFGWPHRIDSNNNDVYLAWIWHEDFVYQLYLKQRDYAPLSPQNLEVSAPTLNHPYIEWGENTEADLKEYKVYRKIDSGNWDPLGTTPNNYYWDEDATVQASMGSTPKTAYYKAKAVDQFNNESDDSNTESIRIEVGGGSQELKIAEILPTYFYVSQNYPNPFNPETNINFGLPEDNIVNLVVYNVQGEKVATLINEQLVAGSYIAKFDGSLFPSGIYIYKIQAGSYSQIKRMLLIK